MYFYLFLVVSFEEKYLIFIRTNLLIEIFLWETWFLMSYLWSLCLASGHKGISPIFLDFHGSDFTQRSKISCELIFLSGTKYGSKFFFFLWLAFCFSTICWKVILPPLNWLSRLYLWTLESVCLDASTNFCITVTLCWVGQNVRMVFPVKKKPPNTVFFIYQ